MKIKRVTSLIAVVLLATVAVVAQQAELEPSAAKLQQHVSYLASDALDGRRTGTAGANDAARYIAGEFSRLDLQPGNWSGTARKRREVMAQYLQRFPYVASARLSSQNQIMLSRFDVHNELKVEKDWMPLGISASTPMENLEGVLVGYGITASELNYNDYAGPKVAGRFVLALSGTPDGDNPHGQFARYEDVRWKAIAARNAGARALFVIAREKNFADDRFSKLRVDNNGDVGIPVIGISQEAAVALIGASVADFEQAAKTKSADAYREISWKLHFSVGIIREEVPAYNVVGVLEGSDPVLKNEYIVIGAHYDHLGRGGEGSLAPSSGEIHHGADDNASGTAGMIELARIFSAQKQRLKRSLIFIGFSGEEEGLLGSNYYVNHPLVPLANTVAMINMDMIGRMRDRKLSIGGIGTSQEWRELVRQANTAQSMTVAANSGSPAPKGVPIVVSANGRPIMTVDPNGTFELTLTEDGYGPSDHSSFYTKQIPVLFFFTGAHNDYHKPSDTFDKINYNDEARILGLVARIVRDVDSAPKRLSFTTAKSDATPRTGGFRVYLGTIPNYADSNNGLLLDGVRDDSPAAKAGLKAGDRIVKIGTREVKNVYDYTYALGEMKAGQEYVVEVMRGSEKLTLKITPEARK
ncbi:MAG TPA: M20/M25/M40 family metallo-hydrolase [Pyrinomonadaceae bacterium]